LGTEEGELSPMANRINEEKKAFFIRFDGKVNQSGNARTVNQFTVGIPKGYRG
jgi:hypothetical protein